MKIIYGSSNKHKVEEVETFFKNHQIKTEILSLADIGFNEEIDENSETFEGNSMIKAKAVKKYCKKNNINEIIVTDDAGLCVDSLGGRPGVHSARYAGDHADQITTLNKLMSEMKDVPKGKRTAKFVCVLTTILPDGNIVVCRGETEGCIAEEVGTLGGLTFCPVFIPKGSNKVMNDMTDEEKEQTHREKALKELINKLNIK